MKKIVFLIYLFLITTLFADEFVIKSFNELSTDLSARKFPRKDVNDQNCAILKVRTDLDGLIFDANLGVEGNIEKKPGEMWIYVSPGEKQIRISKEGFILLPYNIPITIKENSVYQMILTNKDIDNNENTTGYILLSTDPEKAYVWIDGQFKGQSIIQAELQEGIYSYEIKKEMYHSKSGEFEIVRNETTEVNEILQPNYGSLLINSTPEQNAEITLDNVLLQQKTPFESEKIISGNHTVTIKKAMFESITREFLIKDSEKTNLNLEMKPKFAVVTINTDSQADIYIDNKKIATEKYSGRLLKGNHIITVKKEMYEPINKEIEVIAGKDQTINLPLSPIFGELSIITSPSADIFVDGKFVNSDNYNDILISGIHTIEVKKEKYYTTTKKIDLQVGKKEILDIKLSPITGILSIMSSPPKADIYIYNKKMGTTPKIISDLIIGDYDILLSKDGYADYKKTVTIKENEKITINAEMDNGQEVTISSEPLNADFVINGKIKGTTPQQVLLPIGTNYITLTKKDYYEQQEEFKVVKNKSNYKFIMDPERIQVQVKSNPKGAKIYIDGHYKGKTNKIIELQKKRYLFELKKPFFYSNATEINFAETNSLDIQLSRNISKYNKLIEEKAKKALFPLKVSYGADGFSFGSSFISNYSIMKSYNFMIHYDLLNFEYNTNSARIWSLANISLRFASISEDLSAFKYIFLYFALGAKGIDKYPIIADSLYVGSIETGTEDFSDYYAWGPISLGIGYNIGIGNSILELEISYDYYIKNSTNGLYRKINQNNYVKVSDYDLGWSGVYFKIKFNWNNFGKNSFG